MAGTAGQLFGMTCLGPAEPIRDTTAGSHDYNFHTFSEDDYQTAFDKYLLKDSPTARTMQVDGDNSILRAALGDMLRELLGRQPRKFELETWYTFNDYDRHPIMSREEFSRAISALVEFSATPRKPADYISYDLYRKDWLRHYRSRYEHQHTLRAPMTEAQKVGWHTLKPGPKREGFPLGTTDVTRTEGRTATSYYGHFTMLGA